MTLPAVSSIEMPILLELSATGGVDDVRFLYERLEAYFPQITDAEIAAIKSGENKLWRRSVQKAGKFLDEKKFIRRDRGIWQITEKGRKAVEVENQGFIFNEINEQQLSHAEIQQNILEIGQILGFYAETEFEYYDVIWRENRSSQRISHVFEVQSKGNIDSAFAKLKRGYQAQRSKPFLVLSTEKDTRRARQSLEREFSDISDAIVVLSFPEIQKIYENLNSIKDFLPHFLKI